MSGEKKKVKLFRPVLALVIGLLIMLISFGTYMVHTTLEDVLEEEYGIPVVTHDQSSSQA